MTSLTLLRPLPWITAVLFAFLASAAPRHGAHQPATQAKDVALKEKAPAQANDFPTQARVEYVMQCMEQHGGQSLGNMYHCVCAADTIAARLNYQEYSEALTFTYLFDTPGEKGGEFRDPPRSKELREKLKAARKEAEACFPPKPAGAEGEKK